MYTQYAHGGSWYTDYQQQEGRLYAMTNRSRFTNGSGFTLKVREIVSDIELPSGLFAL